MYFLSGTPSWTPADCGNMTMTSSFHHTQTEEDGKILSVDYKELVSSSTIMNKMTFLLSSNRSIYETYSGLAPMGQSVMGLSDYKCQGPYGSDFSKKSTGSGAAWHPGKKGHELRADVLSYLLLSLLEEVTTFFYYIIYQNIFYFRIKCLFFYFSNLRLLVMYMKLNLQDLALW